MQDSVESGSLELWRMSLGPEAGECTYTCTCMCVLYTCTCMFMYMYIVCVYICTCIYVHVSVHTISYAHNIIYMATQLSSWSFFPCLCFGSSLQPYHASMHAQALATSYSQLKH